jgi:hypothetical protein
MLVYFMPIWHFCWSFSRYFCGLLTYFSLFGIFVLFWYVVPRKIWQPWLQALTWSPAALWRWADWAFACCDPWIRPRRTPSVSQKTSSTNKQSNIEWELGGETPSRIRAWSLIQAKKTIVLFESRHSTEKSEAISCARRCRSSWFTRWWICLLQYLMTIIHFKCVQFM